MNRRGFLRSSISVMAIAATLKFTGPAMLGNGVSGPEGAPEMVTKGNNLENDVTRKFVEIFLKEFETDTIMVKTRALP